MSKSITKPKGKKRKTAERLFGVIDIGSNSVRLVVYQGLGRNPQTLFNEKVLCGLGRAVGQTGRMGKGAVQRAMSTLSRFALLCQDMELDHIEAVATAAVRDAENGPEFVAEVERRFGFRVKVLSGKKEARLSALGVISGMPDAQGIAGDLGGGSLELIQIADGDLLQRVTLPIGPVRLLGEENMTDADRRKGIRAALGSVGWLAENKGGNFYLVGGSWRAIARLYMAHTRSPLPILQGYTFSAREGRDFCRALARQHFESLRQITGLSLIPDRRVEVLPLAAEILDQIIGLIKPRRLTVSALGLREGLLYNQLNHAMRAQDPLIAATRDLARLHSRFPEHADRIMNWIEPLFVGETAAERRLRYVAALMSDISWRGHPDFRAERAVYETLFGRFVAISHPERAVIGLALYDYYGGSSGGQLRKLCQSMLDDHQIWYARTLGAALRLAQRLSGGTLDPLQRSALKVTPETVTILLDRDQEALFGEVVARRLNDLAKLLSRNADMRLRA